MTTRNLINTRLQPGALREGIREAVLTAFHRLGSAGEAVETARKSSWSRAPPERSQVLMRDGSNRFQRAL